MRHFLITAPIRRGSADAVRRILREGPPYDLAETSLDRHRVFLSGGQLVFLFEGTHAEEEAARLLRRPGVFGRASRLGAHLVGRPEIPEEVFGWVRPERLEGIDFSPLPGPGDSEGGPID